jgi:putative pre-16S rRNA nuclease
MRILALDIGERRIGLAVCDTGGFIATPLATIRRASKAEDFGRIAEVIREQGVGRLLVGQPLNVDDSPSPQAQRIERYAMALAEALRRDGLDLPMVFWDEHLSSRHAQEAMLVAGRKGKDRRARIDAVAAAVILQEYLNAQRLAPPSAVEEATG